MANTAKTMTKTASQPIRGDLIGGPFIFELLEAQPAPERIVSLRQLNIEATKTIDSLLFGLYGEDGLLHFVGHSRYFDAAEIAKLLEPLKGGTGFTGRAPGGKRRWTGKAQKMVRLDPILVAELSADHISGSQFRHGSRLVRWRTDKAPEDRAMDQIRLPPRSLSSCSA